MAEQKAAVEVKQEGEFTLKGKNIPKRKVKDLGNTSKEPVKMEIKKPVEEKVEAPKIDLTKKEDNAVQERKTEEIPVGDKPETSREVDKEVRVSDTNDKEASPLQVIEEITEEVKPKEQVKEKPQLIETPKLPENVEKLVTFMNETGGTVEDYVELNKDYSKLSNDQLLHEYLRKTKPHLDKEDIDLIMEDYQYEEDIDDPKEIRKKKLAYKEAVASAKKDLEVRKTKYYAEIKNRPGVTQELQ